MTLGTGSDGLDQGGGGRDGSMGVDGRASRWGSVAEDLGPMCRRTGVGLRKEEFQSRLSI